MDEEVEVKAPVTRLRRRISVEQFDDGKLSPAPSTPTKKRGGRRVAKPELDLIDENVENNLKNSARKSVVKDIVDTVEEKPITPSRRSTRIKSNTSIVSDTVQNFDSPRAKRAARRTSQVGSDNEMPLTPVRQTRRTRKDSTSSVEKQVEATSAIIKNTTQIPEIISEEPENNNKTSNNELKNLNNENKKLSPVRKSPRLLNKKSRSSNSSVPDDENSSSVESNKSDTHNTSGHNNRKTEKPIVSSTENMDNAIDSKGEIKSSDKHMLSLSSTNLIKDLDTNPKKISSHINKSLSEAQKLNKVQSKRHRTKSWTAITTVSVPNEGFYSDNENTKIKHKDSILCDVIKNNILKGSGDNSKLNKSKCIESHIDELNSSGNNVKSKSKKKEERDTFLRQTPNKLNANEEANNLTINHKIENIGQITNLFQKDPSNNIQTLIVMEDSDSNSIQMNIHQENEDQCVPVVDDQLKNRSDKKTDYTSKSLQNKKEDSKDANDVITNDTCEPMDVDVTLPDILQNKESEMQSKLVLNSSLDSNIKNNLISSNTKRKSSSLSTSQNLEKSDNENKSTLILSQLKDISSTDNNILKSPQISNNKRLSKSSNILDVTQEDTKVNKNLSLNYLTSTPIQQKTGTCDQGNNKSKNIFHSNISKEKVKTTPKKDVSGHPSTEDSNSEKESTSSENSNLLDNEAEEASDDYESGDSQDDEERQYQIDNEILEKGETLTSEDELTNDSDYEKDSFLVSSDEEDNELLSGSGDDLSMSDKELKMTTKSKKKYNDRKLKEQKQASREMFEARHKLNLSRSSKSSKVKNKIRQRLESSQSDDDIVGPKKNKRNRLNSTANDHAIKSDRDSSICQRENKKRGLSESSCNENLLVEKEITICEEITNNITDPLGTQIKSEPNTPVKESNNSVGFINTDIIKGTPCEKNTSNSSSFKPKDPLENSDDSSSNLSSAEENIAQNYDNMLNELKIQTGNQSLNMDEKYKIKSNPKIPIVENLNLTQPIKSKNKSSQSGDTLNTNKQSTNKMLNVKSTDNLDLCPKTKPSDKLKQISLENDCSLLKPNNNNVEKSKLGNVSLNLDKKTKKARKQSIMDQLNITQIKEKLISDDRKKNMSGKSKAIENSNSDDSSDSIDLKLLFSEDSTNSGDLNKENRRKTGESLDDFIPLKKSQAKTDIRAKEDTGVKPTKNNKSLLDENVLKTKKPKALPENEEDCNDEKREETPFFVDTFGTHSDSSANEDKEAKINMNSTSQANNASSTEDSEDDAAPLEMPCIKEKSTINEDNLSKQEEDNIIGESDNAAKTSKENTPESENKKVKKMSLSHNLSQLEKTIDKSLTKTPETVSKKKKMSGSFNVSNLESFFSLVKENSSSNDRTINKTPSSEIKKIKKLSESNISDCDDVSTSVEANTKEVINKSVTKTPKSEKKKKKRLSESLNKFDENFSEANNSKEDLFRKDQIDPKSGETKSKNDASDECSKKRKRKSSLNTTLEIALEDKTFDDNSQITNKSVLSQNKKRKISQNTEYTNIQSQDTEKPNVSEMTQNTSITKQDVNGRNVNEIVDSSKILNESGMPKKSKKKLKNSKTENQLEDSGAEQYVNTESCKQNIPHRGQSKNQDVSESVNSKFKIDKNQKRKHRDDDDDANKALKVLKENSLDQIHIPRLPHSLLNQLEDKPNKGILTAKKHKAISTTEFVVEETKKRKNKPSNYLEESIYINENESPEAKQQRGILKKPKVLPFIPTATTSNSGYTTNFKVNIVPQEIKFVAQSNNVTSFKNDYLYSKKIKRLGTYELYKRNRNIKISKF